VRVEESTERGLLIEGEEVPAASGETIPVVNPAIGEVFAKVASAGVEDVDRAVSIARKTFESRVWRDASIHERAHVLNRFADNIERHLGDLFRIETLNNGRPIRETKAQISRLPEWYRYNAALLLADRDSVAPMPGPYLSYTKRFPLGVVGILSSFNHPLMIGSKSLAPALTTGNSVVLKPSEQTPLTTLMLGDVAADSGFPPGVLNVITGLGPVAGAALCEHPDVAKITFTGGTSVGSEVAVAAARRFAKTTLELGGKTPVLVFADAQLEEAVKGCAFGGFIAAGQTCIAGSRILVERSIHDEFVDRLVAQAKAIRVGDPSSEETQLGPVISRKAQERILNYIDLGVRDGAKVATGGGVPTVPGCEGGYFVEPTVLVDVDNSMIVAREEIFGPVVVVIPFEDEERAIARANDCPFGLGSAIWSRDVARAHRVAEALEFGIVWVNDHHRLDPSLPWGGVRDSGIGREGGWESFHDFTHVKSVTVRTAPDPVDWYGEGSIKRLN
jgi:phenylacetaldehyde dehydrogenase